MIEIIAYDDRTARDFQLSELDGAFSHPGVWIDVTKPSGDELQILQQRFQLHPLAVEDVLHREQRPKIEEYDAHLFTCLHLATLTRDEFAIGEVFLFLGDKWLITAHYDSVDVIDELKRTLRQPGVPRLQRRPVDFLYYAIIDSAVDHHAPLLDIIGEKLDYLEDRVTEEREVDPNILHELNLVRKQLAFLRKSLLPTREMMGSVVRGIYAQISDESERYFRDVYDHSQRLIDSIETYRAVADSIRDSYLSNLTARSNEVMRVFTVIATIFLPPTLLASLYGMNLPLPGHSDPNLFHWILGGSVVTGLIEVYLFRRRRWL